MTTDLTMHSSNNNESSCLDYLSQFNAWLVENKKIDKIPPIITQEFNKKRIHWLKNGAPEKFGYLKELLNKQAYSKAKFITK